MDITAVIAEILSAPAALPGAIGTLLLGVAGALHLLLPLLSDRVNERAVRLAKARRKRAK